MPWIGNVGSYGNSTFNFLRSLHGVFQAETMEWVAISSSKKVGGYLISVLGIDTFSVSYWTPGESQLWRQAAPFRGTRVHLTAVLSLFLCK